MNFLFSTFFAFSTTIKPKCVFWGKFMTIFAMSYYCKFFRLISSLSFLRIFLLSRDIWKFCSTSASCYYFTFIANSLSFFVRICKEMSSIALGFVSINRRQTNATQDIFFRGDELEVIRVNTRPGSTKMIDMPFFPARKNDIFMDFIRESMSQISLIVYREFSIAAVVEARCPKPAMVGFSNFFPESILRRIIINSHRVSIKVVCFDSQGKN